MSKTCEICKWRSDEFTSACVNDKSEYCCDFVSADDSCDEWEIVEKEYHPWKAVTSCKDTTM